MDWQPIEQAPKDGSMVDLWAQQRERYAYERIPDCWFFQGKWFHTRTIYDDGDEAECEVFNPTHYMPLPPPPED